MVAVQVAREPFAADPFAPDPFAPDPFASDLPTPAQYPGPAGTRRARAVHPSARRKAPRRAGAGQLRLLGQAAARPVVVPRTAATQRSVVYRRRRAVALAGLTLLLAGLWFALQAAVGGAGGGPLTATGAATGTPVAAKVWVVRPGDTLWRIALQSGARGDIRPVVDRLSAQTGGRPLQVGERILLP